MTLVLEIAVMVAILIGTAFSIIGLIGYVRLPDVYTRLHGTTKCTTFGSILIYSGVIAYGLQLFLSGGPEYAPLSVHTALALIFILLTNPVGAHAIARAAHRSGVLPRRAVVDKLKEDEE